MPPIAPGLEPPRGWVLRHTSFMGCRWQVRWIDCTSHPMYLLSPRMTPSALPSSAAGGARGTAGPSIRSRLLAELARRRDRGEDISSRQLSGVLAREYGCSRALVIGARRTILESQHARAYDELRSHFGCGAAPEAG